jgi:MFS family permease
MSKSVNKVIKVLMSSSLALNSGWGFLMPVFAIFVLEKITISDPVAAAKVAGFSALVYWISKSSLQIPIAKYLDKNHGEIDDFWFSVVGIFLASLTPFGFIWATSPWHVYALQFLHALGMAMFIPSWSAIFTRHIDKGREALAWGLNSTVLGFGVGITGALGGIIATAFGFNFLFVLVGGLSIISSASLLLIRKNISPYNKPTTRFPPETVKT